MECTTFTLGDLDTNTYLLWDEISTEAILIDPADSGDFLSEELLHRGLTLQHIILTHGHFDHCLGLLELHLNFAVPIWLHPADAPLLARAHNSAEHWLKRQVDPIPAPTHQLQDGLELLVGSERLTILHTPGHTPGSCCVATSEMVCTGDTLFKDSVGSTDHAYSNRTQLWKSVTKLRGSHQGKLGSPGHGEQFLI